MKKSIFILLLSLLPSVMLKADEGMWMVNLIDKALALKMKDAGMRIPSSLIYSDEGQSISNAVVSLDFECTGSMVSENGLMITNHHCAYGDIHSLSNPDNNYLEKGFWAMNMDEEIPIPGKKLYFLKYIVDVTSDVNDFIELSRQEGKNVSTRRMFYLIEKAVSDETGFHARLSSMWAGEKYYMSLYEVYSDVRLVAAPPVSIAAFGGEKDNWSWPQQMGDFAIYRVYTAPDGSPAEYSEENIPMFTKSFLKISDKDYDEGDFTMVIGYPASSDRYCSSFAVDMKVSEVTPVTARIRGNRMEIIRRWMARDPQVRLKYSNEFFNISNRKDYDEGEMNNVYRYHILDSVRSREIELAKWMSSKSCGNLIYDLGQKYGDIRDIVLASLYFRETVMECSGLSHYVRALMPGRGNANDTLRKVKELKKGFLEVDGIWDNLDPRVEKELMEYMLSEFYSNVDRKYWSPFHVHLYVTFGGDYAAMTDYVWKGSFFTNKSRYDSLRVAVEPLLSLKDSEILGRGRDVYEELGTAVSLYDDPMYQLLCSQNLHVFYNALNEVEDGVSVRMLEDEYERQLYRMKAENNDVQYPDANSTMRVSYGKVAGISPSDAVTYMWRSTTDGVLQKYNPDEYVYRLDDDFKALLESGDWGRWASSKMSVNFMTDNDIAAGSSGSPVLDADGNMIGIAFDGNRESLAGSLYYQECCNRSICLDIRYVLWILDKYAGEQWLLEELGF